VWLLATGTFADLGERFAAAPVVEDSFVMAMRHGHPALAGELTPPVVAALPYLEISSSGEPSGIVDDWLGGHALTRDIAHRAPRLSAAAILARTDLVAVLSRRLGEHWERTYGLSTRELPFAPRRSSLGCFGIADSTAKPLIFGSTGSWSGRLSAGWHRHRNAGPFKRNERMLEVFPIGVAVFPGSGIFRQTSPCKAPPSLLGRGATAQQRCLQAGGGGFGHGAQPRVAGTADRVRNHDERIAGHAEHARHQLGGGHEPLGHDTGGGDLVTFGGYGVMQTARRATASIADPGDDGVPIADLGHDVRIGRGAEIRFDPGDDMRRRELVTQNALEMGEEALCPFLAVRDEPDGLSGEGVEAGRRLSKRRRYLVCRIEHLQGHSTISP
jgi:hypothetical protein